MNIKDGNISFKFKDNSIEKIDTAYRFRKRYPLMKFDVYADEFNSEYNLSESKLGDIYRSRISLMVDGTPIDSTKSVYILIIGSHIEFEETLEGKISKTIYTILIYVSY